MKKIPSLLIAGLLILLAGCGVHEHTWKAATCTEPKTCTECEKTEGNALGHTWEEATCSSPKTCSRCGETEGAPLGHTVENWTQIEPSSCTEHGIESGVCLICGETVEQELALLDHTPGEWEVTVAATENSRGIRVKKCLVCGKELEKEPFSLSKEEIKSLYISKCKTIAYDSLARTPGEYKGENVKFSGYVVQVCSEASSSLYYSTYRVATSGRYSDVVYVKVDNYGTGVRILEDDYITFYGTYDGIYTYTTVRGDKISIPSVTAEYVD